MNQPILPQANLLTALSRARAAAEDHMIKCERDGTSWREETISELVWVNARPFVMYADFTRRQERAVGADWLWWWVDDSSECFGMLVQAKRVRRRNERLTLDFRTNHGEQMSRLFRIAEMFQVPATYVLYFGSVNSRAGLTCGSSHASDCARCRQASVSVMTGLQAELTALLSPRDAAADAFRSSVPLEDLADPSAAPGPVGDLSLRTLDSDVQAFLLRGQTGARHVARTIFKAVAEDRLKDYSATVAERVDNYVDTVFVHLPRDKGHFSEPYFPHVLRGLRVAVPAYVQDVLAGQPPPASVTEHLGGIVVVRC